MARSSLCSSMKQQTISNSATSGNTKQAASYQDHFKVKSSSWDAGNYEYNCINNWRSTEEAGDLVGVAGFSWPPRSYTCSFCKREFRSAQALGGHMNVHRRDRARLRHSSPITDHNQYYYNNINNSDTNSVLNLNLDIPNNPSTFNYSPNPNSIPRYSLMISQSSSSSPPPPPLSSLLTKFPQFSTTLPPLSANVVEVNVNRKPCITTKDFIKMNKAEAAPKLAGLFGAEKVISSSACEKVYKKAAFLGLDLEIGLIGQSEEELDLELRLGYTN